jgi:hypothetical protein
MRLHSGVSMKTRLVLLPMIAGALAGCFGDDSTLEIRPRGSLTDSADLAGLVLEIEGQTIAADDFRPDESGLAEVKLGVPGSGELEIGVVLNQSGRAAGTGTVRWSLKGDHEWGADIFRQVADPMQMCMGCAGTQRIEIAPWAQRVAGESIWFAWGGKPRGSDVVY